jgi:hypothetical protein
MSNKKIIGYKVRDTKTGLYLRSLSRNEWTRYGKIWSRKSDVFATINAIHIQNKIDSIKYLEPISDWELVELVEESTVPMVFFLDQISMA